MSMTTPRVTVPVDGAEVTITLTGKVSDTMPDRPGWFRVTGHKFIFSATGDDAAIRLSAAPAPEGGAFTLGESDLFEIADILRTARGVKHVGSKDYAVADEIVVFVNRHPRNVPALATREEAPEKAGEFIGAGDADKARGVYGPLSKDFLINLLADRDAEIAALRAQPQARGDAK